MYFCCPVCSSTNFLEFIHISQVPVHCNVLWPSREQAFSAPKGDILLGFCRDCGHIFNLAFNPELVGYTQEYENSLHFSPRFQSYISWLANHLIDRYGLQGKEIIEIGSGKGEFLKLICERGGNCGTGFDPSYVPSAEDEQQDRCVRFIQEFYSEQYLAHPADLVCSRHVLEHIRYPATFIQMLRRGIGNGQNRVVFIEVPNVAFIIQDRSIWDIIYEHCSYFSQSSMDYLFQRCGFKSLDLYETYAGQFLCIEALPDEPSDSAPVSIRLADREKLAQGVVAFGNLFTKKVSEWQETLSKLTREGKRVVVWGAGSKGVTFLNILKTQSRIDYVVDINPRKTGKYVAGTGQRIVTPDFLRKYRPDNIILMNGIYQDEVSQQLKDLAVRAELLIA